MKKIFALALAAAAMVSCSNDEIIGLNQQIIGFDNAFVDNSTRLADPSVTTGNITDETLYVWGTTQGNGTGEGLVQIFNGVPVTYSTAWGYSAEYNQYWIAGNKYNFAALVNADPAKVKTKTAVEGGEETYLPLYLEFTADGTTDLLYARSAEIEGKATGNGAVAFTFAHLLSKVQFSFKNTMTDNTAASLYQYLVKDIEISSKHNTATYAFQSGTWGGYSPVDNSTTVYDFGNIKKDGEANAASLIGAVGAVDVATSENALLLIPHTYTNNTLTLTCTIETYLNGSLVNSEPYERGLNVTIDKGCAYNFVLSKGAPGDLIEFSVTKVTDWTEQTATDI